MKAPATRQGASPHAAEGSERIEDRRTRSAWLWAGAAKYGLAAMTCSVTAAGLMLLDRAKAGALLSCPSHPTWLPVAPWGEFVILPRERRAERLRRYWADHGYQSGCLLENEAPPDAAWLRQRLAAPYRPGPAFTDRSWRLTWYQAEVPAA